MVDHSHIPLGVIGHGKHVGIFARTNTRRSVFRILWNRTGGTFPENIQDTFVVSPHGKKEDPGLCSHISISEHRYIWTITYIRTYKNIRTRVIATSIDFTRWLIVSETPATSLDATVIESPYKESKYLLFTGGVFFKFEHSKNLHTWKQAPGLIMTSRAGQFDAGMLTIFGAMTTDRGIIIVYDTSYKENGQHILQAGAALIDVNDPTRIIWRSNVPLWKAELKEKVNNLRPIGITHNETLMSLYWASDDGVIVKALIDGPIHTELLLKKYAYNPVLSPIPHRDWTANGVFNPAAFKDMSGTVHIIFRAVGADGISRFGYSSSHDNIHFEDHDKLPVFSMIKPPKNTDPTKARRYDPTMYPSGGSWGGCEDPRMVNIDGTIYVTFSAFDSWNCIRIGLTTLSEKNFLKKKWKWTEPLLISPKNKINKNWVIFPEKFKGKFAVLHSISPEIEIAYVSKFEDLASGKKIIKSNFGNGKARESWDTYVRGAGPPPLKTKEGWLVLYHAINKNEPSKYKLGAMLLDLKNPKKILARSQAPLLEPEMWYENDWKPGVVYACGAVIEDDTLYVYYGGGDKHTCVATAPLNELLDHIKKNVAFKLSSSYSLI